MTSALNPLKNKEPFPLSLPLLPLEKSMGYGASGNGFATASPPSQLLYRKNRRGRIGVVAGDGEIPGLDELDQVPLEGGERLYVILWIDDPEGFDTTDLLRRAATHIEIYTADAFEVAGENSPGGEP
jgi:hypothetical protein